MARAKAKEEGTGREIETGQRGENFVENRGLCRVRVHTITHANAVLVARTGIPASHLERARPHQGCRCWHREPVWALEHQLGAERGQ